MKTKGGPFAVFFRNTVPGAVRPMVLGMVVAGLLAGWNRVQGSGLEGSDASKGDLARREPGTIAVTSSSQPAKFSFQKAQGRVESAGEGAQEAAARILNTPNLWHPQLEAAVGVIGFVAAPFAAAYGALTAPHQRLPADKLSEAERDLENAMKAMAEQENLRQSLFSAASQQTRRRLLLAEQNSAERERAGLVLETCVEELRLVHTGHGDKTYALHITARARMVRGDDGTLISERPYQYQSGKAMFIDWTREGGLTSVAQTGYRQMAEQMAKDMLAPMEEQPVLLGAGFGNSSPRKVENGKLAVRGLQRIAGGSSLAQPSLDGRAGVQFASYQLNGAGSVELYSKQPDHNFFIQTPLTRQDAVTEAEADTEWCLDGLENHRNFVVQVGACLAAVPVGLWKQAKGAVEGVSGRQLEAGNASLKQVSPGAEPHRLLANEVARRLVPETSASVVLVSEPLSLRGPSREPGEAQLLKVSAIGKPDRSHAGGTVLEIEVLDARLAGKPGVNSRLSLSLEAQATLRRKSDGQELYSCPVQYRSAARTFKAWAAQDAHLFREEWELANREMGGAIADHLVARGLVPPTGGSDTMVAGN